MFMWVNFCSFDIKSFQLSERVQEVGDPFFPKSKVWLHKKEICIMGTLTGVRYRYDKTFEVNYSILLKIPVDSLID